jgi:putative oxidoreductase
MSKHDILYALARAMFSATFVISAIRHSCDRGAALDEMSAGGMPRSNTLLLGSIMLRLLGGLSVLLGFHARIGGLLLVVFILPATFIVHAFWEKPPEKRVHELTELLNNVAITAGALFIVVSGSGGVSLDALLQSTK